MPRSTISRRLTPAVSLALALALALSTAAPAQLLPNRVAAGDVTMSFVVLWARATTPGVTTFELSRDPAFAQNVRTGLALVTDVARPAKAHFSGLSAGRKYYYRATDAAGFTDYGTFRTLRAPTSEADLRFGVSGDSRGELAPFNSLANAPARDLDLFVHLGDSIYADVASPALPGVNQASTLAQFRAKHDEVLSAHLGVNGIGDLRASTAVLTTLDDHEVTNDFSGGAHPSTDPRFDQTGGYINETNLFYRAMVAFLDYAPIVAQRYGATGDPRTAQKLKFYRHRTLGRGAAVFVLDPRSFRDAPLPDVTNPTDPAQVGAFLVGSFNPQRTMLGAAQLGELKNDLLAAQAAGIVWKFVMVPEPMQNLGVVAASDRFEGYAAERTNLLSFIQTNGITNVAFVAADIHGTLVNNLTYQNFPGGPQIPTAMFEITTGAIAYDAPFGPTVVGIAAALGLVTPPQFAFYNLIPTAAKDVFVEQLVNAQLLPLGLDPLGLQGSPVNATLLSGGYVATHVYGWTEFEIAGDTGVLTVTTYGLAPNVPGASINVVSRFAVTPQ